MRKEGRRGGGKGVSYFGVANTRRRRKNWMATHPLFKSSPLGFVCVFFWSERNIREVDTGELCLGGLLGGSLTLILTLRPAHKFFILRLPNFLENFFVNNFPALVVNVTRSLRKTRKKKEREGAGQTLSPLRTPLN